MPIDISSLPNSGNRFSTEIPRSSSSSVSAFLENLTGGKPITPKTQKNENKFDPAIFFGAAEKKAGSFPDILKSIGTWSLVGTGFGAARGLYDIYNTVHDPWNEKELGTGHVLNYALRGGLLFGAGSGLYQLGARSLFPTKMIGQPAPVVSAPKFNVHNFMMYKISSLMNPIVGYSIFSPRLAGFVKNNSMSSSYLDKLARVSNLISKINYQLERMRLVGDINKRKRIVDLIKGPLNQLQSYSNQMQARTGIQQEFLDNTIRNIILRMSQLGVS